MKLPPLQCSFMGLKWEYCQHQPGDVLVRPSVCLCVFRCEHHGVIIFNGSAIVHTSSSGRIREQGRGFMADYEEERERNKVREDVEMKKIKIIKNNFIFSVAVQLGKGIVRKLWTFTFF